jgi:hypothetical protein
MYHAYHPKHEHGHPIRDSHGHGGSDQSDTIPRGSRLVSGIGLSGGVSRGARRLVVVALIFAAFAASTVATAAAAPFPRESNAVFEPMRWVDHARDITGREVDRAAVLVHTTATHVREPYLLTWGDLSLSSRGVVLVNPGLWSMCYTYGCCSSTWYWSTYPGWIFQFCAYEGRGFFDWRQY